MCKRITLLLLRKTDRQTKKTRQLTSSGIVEGAINIGTKDCYINCRKYNNVRHINRREMRVRDRAIHSRTHTFRQTRRRLGHRKATASMRLLLIRFYSRALCYVLHFSCWRYCDIVVPLDIDIMGEFAIGKTVPLDP